MSKLELYNIYAGYEESKPVLKDISFFVEKGEFIVLLGTSGCGKTTILNLIAGMIPISAGELYIDGVKSNDTPPRKRNIAMVFQNYALYPTMTAYENIAFPLQNAHYKKKDIDSSVKSIAVELGIDDLSQGYRYQRNIHDSDFSVQLQPQIQHLRLHKGRQRLRHRGRPARACERSSQPRNPRHARRCVQSLRPQVSAAARRVRKGQSVKVL